MSAGGGRLVMTMKDSARVPMAGNAHCNTFQYPSAVLKIVFIFKPSHPIKLSQFLFNNLTSESSKWL
jgi:hypothetical protein